MDKDCIFCKIVNKEIPTEFVYESKNVVAFADINPSTDIHILVVPKKHIDNLETIEENDAELTLEMIKAIQSIVKKENPSKYRVIINGRNFLEVSHLHWHLQIGNLKKHAIESILNGNR